MSYIEMLEKASERIRNDEPADRRLGEFIDFMGMSDVKVVQTEIHYVDCVIHWITLTLENGLVISIAPED